MKDSKGKVGSLLGAGGSGSGAEGAAGLAGKTLRAGGRDVKDLYKGLAKAPLTGGTSYAAALGKVAVKRVFIPLLVVGMLAPLLIIASLSAGGLDSVEPSNEAFEALGEDGVDAVRTAGDGANVPWPVLAGISYATTRHGTFDPYTQQPVAEGTLIGEGQDSGGQGPLLLNPTVAAAAGVDPRSWDASVTLVADHLATVMSDYADLYEQQHGLSPAEWAMFNAEFMPGGGDQPLEVGTTLYSHVELWRTIVAQATSDLVMLPYDGACMVNPEGHGVPQQIELVVTCEMARRDEPLQVLDPVTQQPFDPDVGLSTLIAEMVGVSWEYSQWGEEGQCDPDRVSGGVLPLPPGGWVEEQLPSGETVTRREYDRCDPLDSIRESARRLLDAETVPLAQRPGSGWARYTSGWSQFPGTLGVVLSDSDLPWQNRFLVDGPATAPDTQLLTESCQAAAALWAHDLVNEPTQILPRESWSTVSPFDHDKVLAWVRERQRDGSWLVMTDACGSPQDDDGQFRADWVRAARQALRTAQSTSPQAPADSGRVDGLIDALDVQLAGGVQPRWGVTSSVARLANPPVTLDVPPWARAARTRFADEVIAAALVYSGYDCGPASLLNIGSPGGSGAAGTTTGGHRPEPETAVRAAYQVGLRGDALVMAVAIARAESNWCVGCDNSQQGPGGTRMNTDGSIDYGMWQINSVHNPPLPPQVPNIYDPDVNAQFMYRVSSGGTNWRPWVVYNTGVYARYLDVARQMVDEHLGPAAYGPPPESTGGGGIDGAVTSVSAPSGIAALCGPGFGLGYHSDVVAHAIEFARSRIGTPYSQCRPGWPACGPGGRYGDTHFDCSGLAVRMFREAGVEIPARMWTTLGMRDATNVGAPYRHLVVSDGFDYDLLQPGDVLFWTRGPTTGGHTIVYIGGGEIIHSTTGSANGVQIGSLDRYTHRVHRVFRPTLLLDGGGPDA